MRWIVLLALLLGACASPARRSAPSPTPASSATPAPSTAPLDASDAPAVIAERIAAQVAAVGANDGGPAARARGLAFIDDAVGVLATSDLTTWAPGPLNGRGRIQRTIDGGTTWHDVLVTDEMRFTWAGVAGDELLAAAWTAPGDGGAPRLARSRDRGVTWQVTTPQLPAAAVAGWRGAAFRFIDAAAGYAGPSFAEQHAPRSPLLRTLDGGRTWAVIAPPAGAYVTAMWAIDRDRLVATGSAPSCGGAAWRSEDAGATWSRVACTDAPLLGVTFTNDRAGWAVGGWSSRYAEEPGHFVLRTADGGRTWTHVDPDRRGTDVLRDVVALDANRLVAIAGTCSMGANDPCVGGVATSVDGGATWTLARASAMRLAATARAVFAISPWEGALWRSADLARWTPLIDASELRIGIDAVVGRDLYVNTQVGRYVSHDEGRTWTAWDPGIARPYAHQVSVARDVVAATTSEELRVSNDGGRTWRSEALPPGGPLRFAFTDADHAFSVGAGSSCGKAVPEKGRPAATAAPYTAFASSDGGATWSARGTLDVAPTYLAASANAVVISGRGTCARSPAVAVSTDGGARWRVRRFAPTDGDCFASVADDRAVWASCSIYEPGLATGRHVIWRSADLGATWVEIATGGTLSDVRAVSATRAYADLGGLAVTSDGGRTWTPLPVRLPR